MTLSVEALDHVPAGSLPPMIPSRKTALLVIDAQVDFIAPYGLIGRAGVDLAPLESPLKKVNDLIAAARTAGVAAVLVRVVTEESTDSTALKLLTERRGLPPEAIAICRAGTDGANYYGVDPRLGDIHIEKPLYSSFVGTTLDEQLRARGIDTLVVCGFTTECCVDSTVRDAFHRNYNVFVVSDACAAYGPDLHYGALNALSKNCALLVSSSAVIATWRTSR